MFTLLEHFANTVFVHIYKTDCFTPKHWESQISTRSCNIHEYLWGLASWLHVSTNIFLVSSAFCMPWGYRELQTEAKTKLSPTACFIMIYSIFVVNASGITLVRLNDFECMVNILGCYHPTLFCFLVLRLNFLCIERWMLMSSCPVVLSYLFQTWKWKQGDGAICWLWWIPATYSHNRTQWPHTGEMVMENSRLVTLQLQGISSGFVLHFANAWLLNICPATLPILVSCSHQSITALYSLSCDSSHISSLSHRNFPFIFNFIPFKEFSGWWLSIMVMCTNFLPFSISISFSFLIWSLLTVTSHFSGILSYRPKVYLY